MTKFLNISTDTSLGGISPSNDAVSSQRAVKIYVDSAIDSLQSSYRKEEVLGDLFRAEFANTGSQYVIGEVTEGVGLLRIEAYFNSGNTNGILVVNRNQSPMDVRVDVFFQGIEVYDVFQPDITVEPESCKLIRISAGFDSDSNYYAIVEQSDTLHSPDI